jgi:GAF domain-containing protein
MSTIPSERVAETFVEVADTLVDDFDLVDFLTMVTERAAELAGASAAGLMLGDERGQLRFMAASHESARLLELLQLEGGQGPCLECFRLGRPVSHDDLASAADVWPLFSAEAVRLGFHSVQAFPLRHHVTVVGALNTFGPEAHRLDPERIRVVQALADLATIGILQERAIRHGELLAEQLQHALNSRVTIEQAKGALAHIRSIDTDAAFNLMRNHARQNHKRLVDIALAVLEDPTGIPELTKR